MSSEKLKLKIFCVDNYEETVKKINEESAVFTKKQFNKIKSKIMKIEKFKKAEQLLQDIKYAISVKEILERDANVLESKSCYVGSDKICEEFSKMKTASFKALTKKIQNKINELQKEFDAL